MIWEKITNDHSSLQEYRLINNNNKTLILKYNPLHRSARVSFDNQRFLFYLESNGSTNSKILLRNEYGMETGSIALDRPVQGAGNISIDGTRLTYELKNGSLSIYDKTGFLSVESCDINLNSITSENHTAGFDIEITCQLLGLFCYGIFNTAKNTLLQYATAS